MKSSHLRASYLHFPSTSLLLHLAERMDGKSREPERSLEDQIIASVLMERSSVYRDMREISTTVGHSRIAAIAGWTLSLTISIGLERP